MSVLLGDQLLGNGQCQQEGLLVLGLEQCGHHSLDRASTEDNVLASGEEGRGEEGERRGEEREGRGEEGEGGKEEEERGENERKRKEGTML